MLSCIYFRSKDENMEDTSTRLLWPALRLLVVISGWFAVCRALNTLHIRQSDGEGAISALESAQVSYAPVSLGGRKTKADLNISFSHSHFSYY